MADKLSYEVLTQLIGRLYLESQLEIRKLSIELSKVKQERDQALRLIGESTTR